MKVSKLTQLLVSSPKTHPVQESTTDLVAFSTIPNAWKAVHMPTWTDLRYKTVEDNIWSTLLELGIASQLWPPSLQLTSHISLLTAIQRRTTNSWCYANANPPPSESLGNIDALGQNKISWFYRERGCYATTYYIWAPIIDPKNFARKFRLNNIFMRLFISKSVTKFN